MISINLLPDAKQKAQRAVNFRRIVVAISTLLIIVSVAVPVLIIIADFTYKTRTNIVQSKIDKNQSKIKGIKDLSRLLTTQSQINTVDQVDSTRTNGVNFIILLEWVTPSPIELTSTNFDSSSNVFRLSASSPDIPTAESFVDSLLAVELSNSSSDSDDGEFIRAVDSVNITSFNYDQQSKSYSFTLDGTLNPTLWSLSDITNIRTNSKKLKISKDQTNIDLLNKDKSTPESSSEEETTL